MTHDTLGWKLFPFSLVKEARHWYTKTVESVNGSWSKLRDKFCLRFFPKSHIVALRKDILCFQQNEEETIGAAWARFSLLVKSGPVLSIPNHVLLQHFLSGLDTESANHLDASARGSFSYKTPIEGMEILDRITENNSFVSKSQPSREERASSHEDNLVAESDLPLPTTSNSALESSPESGVPKEEEIQPLEPPFKFEYDLFEDFGNTSNYFCKRKPPVPVASTDLMEATFHRENVKKLTAITLLQKHLMEAGKTYYPRRFSQTPQI